MGRAASGERGKKSIFRSIFVPLFLIMLLQAVIFYLAAVYGGVEESLSRNAADILSERLQNQKIELETQLNNRCFDLDACAEQLTDWYDVYGALYGDKPLADNPQRQIEFLADCADLLVSALRQNEVNGVFLILNGQPERLPFAGYEKRYGLCIRDMDQDSNYSGREDLLLERSPSSIVDALGCPLDSWWEAWYTFQSAEEGDFYYNPLNAAWDNPRAAGDDLAYLSGVYRLSGSDYPVVSYSLPLTDEHGYPYAVLGVELTVKRLSALMPGAGRGGMQSCYVLALRDAGTSLCQPVAGAGELYSRCFGAGEAISCANRASTGGFTLTGRGDIPLYGKDAALTVYNNNNPFESRELVLLALADSDELFAYVGQIKLTLVVASAFCLALGLACILAVSRRFAAPITNLADSVRDLKPQAGFRLGRLGITEIDQLVDAIETLNRNVSKSSARTEFFSRMSHDMRTPMNAIISFSSPELLDGADMAEKDDYLQKIHASGVYLLGLINEVLDMTKIESDKVELRPEPVRAADLCASTIPMIQELAQQKHVAFTHETRADADLCALADVQHLNQIVMNLLSNAVKFTPEGGRVRLAAEVSPDPADAERLRCRIVVEDSGIGMSEAFMKELFTPFEQENAAREGTGLGLSIAKKLTELMGGHIQCVSRQGQGTTFTVELPLQRADASALPKPAAPEAERADRAALRGKRVLLCEDNALNIHIVKSLLAKVGVTTDVAQNGREGLELFAAAEAGVYGAVLMDVRMPVMDGLEATRRIRALNRPDAATVPIIAMTANAFDEDVTATREAGMNEHLAKPIETEKFFAVLTRYLDNKK